MNGGAGRKIAELNKKNQPNSIVMNTVISSATSGLTMWVIQTWQNIFNKENIINTTGLIARNDVSNLCHAIIAGTVSITACCNNVELWGASVIGLMGCLIYIQT